MGARSLPTSMVALVMALLAVMLQWNGVHCLDFNNIKTIKLNYTILKSVSPVNFKSIQVQVQVHDNCVRKININSNN